MSKYIPEERLQKLLPGFKLSDIDSYNFLESNFKVFILGHTPFQEFLQNLKAPNSQVAGKTFGSHRADYTQLPMAITLNPSHKRIAVIDEIPFIFSSTTVASRYNRSVETVEKSEMWKTLVTENLRRTITHEFLHALDVGFLLPLPLTEGLADYYALKSQTQKTRFTIKGYHTYVDFISQIVNVLEENGMTEDAINDAFIGGNESHKRRVKEILDGLKGEGTYERIFTFKFLNIDSALKYIQTLNKNPLPKAS